MKTDHIVLVNSFRLTNGGWMVVPFGLHDHPEGYVQTLDETSAQVLVENLRANLEKDSEWPGLPITIGHPGHPGFEDTDGSAYGWIKHATMNADSRELRLKPEWNEDGLKLIQNKRFVYFSPEWAVRRIRGIHVAPEELHAVGLTNKPVIKTVRPLANSKPPKEEDKTMWKELLKLLGLKEDATENQAVEAVTALKTQISEITNEKNTLDVGKTNADAAVAAATQKLQEATDEINRIKEELTTERDAHVETLLDVANSDGRVPAGARKAWKDRFAADHKGTLAVLANATPVMNTASRTATQGGRDKTTPSHREEIITLMNAEKKKGIDQHTAFARVRRARPELFAEG